MKACEVCKYSAMCLPVGFSQFFVTLMRDVLDAVVRDANVRGERITHALLQHLELEGNTAVREGLAYFPDGCSGKVAYKDVSVNVEDGPPGGLMLHLRLPLQYINVRLVLDDE